MFEVGKKYRTRGGTKVLTCIEANPCPAFPKFTLKYAGSTFTTWRSREGSYLCGKKSHGLDLIPIPIDEDYPPHAGEGRGYEDNTDEPAPVFDEDATLSGRAASLRLLEDTTLRKWAVEQLVQAGDFSIDCFEDYSNMLIQYVKGVVHNG